MNDETFQMYEKMVSGKFENIEKKLDDLCQSLDKKYASKNSERVIYGMVGAILLYFLGGVLGLFAIPAVQSALTFILNILA